MVSCLSSHPWAGPLASAGPHALLLRSERHTHESIRVWAPTACVKRPSVSIKHEISTINSISVKSHQTTGTFFAVIVTNVHNSEVQHVQNIKKNQPRNNKRASEQLTPSTRALFYQVWTWLTPTSVPSHGVILSICGGRLNARDARSSSAPLALPPSGLFVPASRLSLSFQYGDLLLVLCAALRKCSTPRSAGREGEGGGGLAPAQAFVHNLCAFLFVSRSGV